MASIDLKDLARRGAEARLAELDAERAELLRAFPGVGSSTQSRRGRRPAAAAVSTSNGAAQPDRKPRPQRRPMNAAERKAVSERMRRYWEQRRTAQGTKKK